MVNWQFATDDVRIEFKWVYPSVQGRQSSGHGAAPAS